MTGTRARHVLVVASQCKEMPPIRDLDDAAHRLHTILLDDTAGGCVPGLAGGESLKLGHLDAADIRTHIGAAIDYAARQHATLVLALLGHAFIPGEEPSLYFMGSDSRDGDRRSAVHINELITEATDDGRLAGFIGVIDTCHAAAGLAGAFPLVGNRAGRSRLAMLLAATASQDAYDLSLSRQLATLLESGVDNTVPHVDVAIAATHINGCLGQQSVNFLTADGDPGPASALWLGSNRRHAVASGLLGARGRRALRDAVALVGDPALAGHLDAARPSELAELGRVLAARPNTPDRNRAVAVVADLVVAMHTTAFIRDQLSDGLTRNRLCTAFRFALAHRSPADLITETDFVEEIALVYPAPVRDCRAAMAQFLVSLCDAGGVRQGDPRLRRWVDEVQAAVPVAEAWQLLRARELTRQLRLVVTLHGSFANLWPDTLEAWLLGDGEVPHHASFDCQPPRRPGAEAAAHGPDQGDVERALRGAVDWAEDLLEEIQSQGVVVEFGRVDIALPTRLLLRWRPEEMLHGMRLGVDYDVLRHWSQRVEPRIRRHAVKRMRAIEGSATAPATVAAGTSRAVDWLDASDTQDVITLKQRLEAGEFLRALGLSDNPDGNDRLADLLLTFTPILVWTTSTERLRDEHRQYVTQSWHRLPAGFLEAYRARWSTGSGDVLADLQFVWDDLQWLEFCREYGNWPPS